MKKIVMVDDGALTTNQVAELFGVTRQRVGRMIKYGQLDAFLYAGSTKKEWRITRESVERYKKERAEREAKKSEGER